MKALLYETIACAAAVESAGARVLKPLGLTPMTFNILNVLKDGPLSQRQIGDSVIVAASSITFQVRQLQRKGLIRRRRADARTWHVSLTPLGAQARQRADVLMDALIARLQTAPEGAGAAAALLKSVREQLPGLLESPIREGSPRP